MRFQNFFGVCANVFSAVYLVEAILLSNHSQLSRSISHYLKHFVCVQDFAVLVICANMAAFLGPGRP